MRVFNSMQRVFVKTNNTTKKINLSYTYSLIFIFAMTLLLDVLFGYDREFFLLIKHLFLSFFTMVIIFYTVNIIKKKYALSLVITDNNILSLALIISLFSKSNSELIAIIASILTAVVKIINYKRNLSAVLYGILFMIIYSIYFTNHLYSGIGNFKLIDYFISPNYVSPIITVIAFIYLFCRKSIKYNIVWIYILTLFLVIFLYAVINKSDLLDAFGGLLINSPMFLAVYALTDCRITPIVAEVQIIYGMIGGIISSILYFVFANLAVVIPMIILPLCLTNYLNSISYKLKCNVKLYYLLITFGFLIIIIESVVLAAIF